jgi:hypothetical protein
MNMLNIDTTQAKSISIEHRVKIIRDDNAENPREWCDHIGTMYCEHRRYTLGDKNARDIRVENEKTGEMEYPEGYITLPLYLYDHSGLTMNTGGFSCRWDSGQVGYIYISEEQAKKEWPGNDWKERALSCMRAEVSEYDNYLTGKIYGFQYEEVAITDDGEEQVLSEDSCWGFNGYKPEDNGISDHIPVPLKDCIITRE